MEQVFSELTFWHWLVLGLILFGIEMMTGTFDLLMVAIAAWLTAWSGKSPPAVNRPVVALYAGARKDVGP